MSNGEAGAMPMSLSAVLVEGVPDRHVCRYQLSSRPERHRIVAGVEAGLMLESLSHNMSWGFDGRRCLPAR